MHMTDYQLAAGRTFATKGHRERLLNAVLGLAGETGELCDLVKKGEFQGHDIDPTKFAEELGDVLWYVAAVATAFGLDLTSVAKWNIEKLKIRYPDGFTEEASRNRADKNTP